ncbi:MAG TPA: SMC family ATPase [Nocardioidaceae bacterium]|nr:SMC family ATPase [Nocardioidaceae bacterium]
MRFHHLTVAAFGPFAGTEAVDFDDLNAGGLFLMTGPTGAGKTSILDAICFALYGSVPGVRGVKALKSHHSPPEARPEVVLDFSIGGRRFVVRRSPEWSRPKRRGEGATTEKASATLVETTGGAEHFLSSRAQEVGHLVSGLIGMRASQFVQVAMLPQGEFARFLRAGTQDRHEVLQQLFKTDRFARIEDWVHEHSRKLRDCADAEQTRVQRLLDTVADRGGADLPEELSGNPLAAADPDRIRRWAAEQVARAQAAHTEALNAHEEAAAQLRAARDRHERDTRTAEAVARRDEAHTARAALAPEAEAEAATAALRADTSAGRCLPVLSMCEEAREAAAAAQLRRDLARDAVAGLTLDVDALDVRLREPIDARRLTELGRALREQITRTEALFPRAQALREVRAARDAVAIRVSELHRDAEGSRERLERLPAERLALEDAVAGLSTTAATAPVLDLQLAAARAALEAATLVPACEAEVARLKDRCRDARDAAADARDRMHDLIGRRLAGMAAELAGRLTAESSCPVCGSSEHPSPARPAEDAVTEAEQASATQTYHLLTTEHTEATGRLADAERRLEGLREAAAGRSPEQAQQLVADVQRRRAAADAAAREQESCQARLRDLTTEQQETAARVHTLETEQAALEQAHRDHVAAVEAAEREIAEGLGGRLPELALEELLDRLRSAARTVEAAERDFLAYDEARTRASDLAVRAEETAVQEGFADAAAASRAALDDMERTRLEELLADRAEVLARIGATLSDPQVQALADTAAPDLAAAARQLEEAERAAAGATRALHQREEAATALARTLARIEDALGTWEPVRTEHERSEAIARLVRGTGPDNYLQMRLSAYVLATRLDQVLDAANERLAQMRDQRYLLERTGKAARRNTQAGLGLQVLDSWTGEVRDPATLSGGETFVVSLSLALGLADVVSQEAGGAEIDTLFVDEGFGTLDADTLDDVMDRLDGLRAGGRTVGVVSHVHELRTRIPTQLHVEKRRSGSRLAVRTLTA